MWDEGTNVVEELERAMEYADKKIEDIDWMHISVAKYGDEAITMLPTDDYQEFVKTFKDVDYDSGYGGQELFGVVVFKDNTWLERFEYDGSEYWDYKETPKRGDIKCQD
jgi:hypothetical protein